MIPARYNTLFDSLVKRIFLLSIWIGFIGCTRLDSAWDKVDIKTSLYASEDLPSVYDSLQSGTEKRNGTYFLVCNVRNRTKMRVYAKLQYADINGNKTDVEFLCSELDPSRWTAFTIPLGVADPALKKREKETSVGLKPISIETK